MITPIINYNVKHRDVFEIKSNLLRSSRLVLSEYKKQVVFYHKKRVFYYKNKTNKKIKKNLKSCVFLYFCYVQNTVPLTHYVTAGR